MRKLPGCAVAARFPFSITAKVAFFHGDSPLVGEEHSISKNGILFNFAATAGSKLVLP